MVSKLVRENLTRRAAKFNLVLDDVSITHVTFSPAFSDAVEAKQIAQQTAQRAAYLVDQVSLSFLLPSPSPRFCRFRRFVFERKDTNDARGTTGDPRKTIHHRSSAGRSKISRINR